MKKNASNTVKLSLDLGNLPPLTAAQRAELKALAGKPDSAIDYSDIPHSENREWMTAADKLTPKKKQVTLRIDADILDFFKDTSTRYQTRMNAVLRAYVDTKKKVHN